MCGIAGVCFYSGIVNEKMLKQMTHSIAHRGPDGEGFHIEDNVGLAHKRLSIIDPEGGHQPMTNEDGTVWVTFNGAIYNYLELRQSLLQKGHRFKSYCDTEVIIHAYEEYGEQCVQKFNGMFAFAIWDSKKHTLFAARDRFGVKPFYYYFDHNKFLFASEIKALHASGMVPKNANFAGINDYVVFQFSLGNKTLFKDISKLEPGFFLKVTFDNGLKVEKSQYWDLKFSYDTYHTEDYYVDKLLFLIEDAVKIRLRSDVPLGSHLSGGLDSSAIVCIASELLGGSGLKTFTGGFNEGKEYNETEYAKIVSKFSNTEYFETILRPEDFQNTLESIIYYLDEPGAGPGVFPQYFVSKLASQHVKVVLGGQGGDEVFMGYARYLVAYLEECLRGAIFETAEKDKYAVTMESIIPNLPMLKTYGPMLQYFWNEGIFSSQEERYFKLVDRSEGMRGLFREDLFAGQDYSPFESFKEIFNKDDLHSYINKMMYFDLKGSLPALLQVEDRTSMAFGLESRIPLLDYRIAELIATIPPSVKFRGGESKALFKKAIKNIVPAQIFNRKDKMGFPVPLVQWYKGELRDYVGDILLGETTKQRGIYNTREIEGLLTHEGKFSRVVWGMLCLELWFRKFID
ncbi:asparagine synthase (glutamine-hydrolyzing) [Desulfosporosinus fructosivorans]